MFRYYPAHFATIFIPDLAHWYNSYVLAVRYAVPMKHGLLEY